MNPSTTHLRVLYLSMIAQRALKENRTHLQSDRLGKGCNQKPRHRHNCRSPCHSRGHLDSRYSDAEKFGVERQVSMIG